MVERSESLWKPITDSSDIVGSSPMTLLSGMKEELMSSSTFRALMGDGDSSLFNGVGDVRAYVGENFSSAALWRLHGQYPRVQNDGTSMGTKSAIPCVVRPCQLWNIKTNFIDVSTARGLAGQAGRRIAESLQVL